MLSVIAFTSWGYDEPSVNLGFTSFLDGGPPAGPGFYFSQYFQYYTSDKLTDNDGHEMLPSFADEDLDVFISLSQLIYHSNHPIHDPNRKYAGADDTQAGQACHVNFTSAYEIIKNKFRVGINGYYFKQITDTQVDGDDVSDSREQVLGLGPGFVIHFSRDMHLFFNAYFETEVENRPKGQRYNFRFIYHF